MKTYYIIGAIMLALIAYGMNDANDKAVARNAVAARAAEAEKQAQQRADYERYLARFYAQERARRAQIARDMQLDAIEDDVRAMRLQQQLDAIK